MKVVSEPVTAGWELTGTSVGSLFSCVPGAPEILAHSAEVLSSLANP